MFVQTRHDIDERFDGLHPRRYVVAHVRQTIRPLIGASQSQPGRIVWCEFRCRFLWTDVDLVAPVANALGALITEQRVTAEMPSCRWRWLRVPLWAD